jgi:hypothetical protein
VSYLRESDVRPGQRPGKRKKNLSKREVLWRVGEGYPGCFGRSLLSTRRVEMRVVLEQEVFRFLAEDPAYQEAVRTERIWRDIAARLEEELEPRVSRIVEEKLTEHIEAVHQAVQTERVWRTVTARLDEELEISVKNAVKRRFKEQIERRFDELFEAAFQHRYSELVRDLGKIHLSLGRMWWVITEGEAQDDPPRDDPADWWKDGYDAETGEELA